MSLKIESNEIRPKVVEVILDGRLEIAAALPETSVFASAQEADRYFDAIQRPERGEDND
ncbi:MAG: hypothetical protein VYE73_14200 [Acidobacteriota bacterium]|nr:hypothetical protein [Acidobacteriota bacterium]